MVFIYSLNSSLIEDDNVFELTVRVYFGCIQRSELVIKLEFRFNIDQTKLDHFKALDLLLSNSVYTHGDHIIRSYLSVVSNLEITHNGPCSSTIIIGNRVDQLLEFNKVSYVIEYMFHNTGPYDIIIPKTKLPLLNALFKPAFFESEKFENLVTI